MDIVAAIIFVCFVWGVGGLLWWLSTRPEEYSVYDPRYYQKTLYEDKDEHRQVITGKRPPPRLTKDEAFSQALIRNSRKQNAN